MNFAKKTKSFCVEFGEQSVLLARLSQEEPPLVVEELKEFAVADKAGLAAYLKEVEGKGPTGYAHACCGSYPLRRLVRRHTLDLKRVKEPAYFNEVLSQQFRVEPEKYSTKLINADDGGEYDSARGVQKDVLFCGLPSEDVLEMQDALITDGFYPERLELGTVALLGALVRYLKFKQSKSPLLLLEIGTELTQSFIVNSEGVDVSRPIPSGIAAMIPVVQKELGLKDEESAKKLFYSNTFDFTGMGVVLVKKLMKELQSSIGFYEVQTGQSIGSVFCTQLPANLGWLSQTMAATLGVSPLKAELNPWLDSLGIRLAEGVTPNNPDERWLGLFALLANHSYAAAVSDQKK